MMPEPDRAFAERCSGLWPGFRPGARLFARKSELITGELDGVTVVAKRLARPSPVWAWYLERELAIYRAFAAAPPPFRAPRLVDAADGILLLEHIPGSRLATRRHPDAELDPGVLAALIALPAQLAAWPGAFPATPPPAAVRSQLRRRLLEDPTAALDWVRDGAIRAVKLGILEPPLAGAIADALAGHPTIAPSHGDLLLRNAIGDGDRVTLVDWECAGAHPADWDLALVWTQLGPRSRLAIDAAIGSDPPRRRAFAALATFALARELAFRRAFRASPASADALRADLARTASVLTAPGS